MAKAILEDLVRQAGYRSGKHVGRAYGLKFWWPFEPIRIKRNLLNYDMIISTWVFEIRHFIDDDVQILLRFHDMMDDKYSKKWDVSASLAKCATIEEVASVLRQGVPFSKNEYGEMTYASPVDDDDFNCLEFDKLLDALEALGMS